MRLRAGRLIIGIVVVGCVVAAAVAATGAAEPPGNNGDVKIEITGVFGGNANHPKPGCTFEVQGFGFDANQSMSFTVEGQGGPNVAGTDTLGPFAVQSDSAGNFGPVGPFVLEPGMYKLDLSTNKPGGHKFKVFRVECAAPATTTTPPLVPTTKPVVPTTTPARPVTPAPSNVAPSPRPAAVVQAQPRTTG
jgi:hypothetical protein